VPEPSDDEIDRLLSRGELGQAHKQRLLRGVLASVQAPAAPRRPRWRWPAFAAVSLAGAGAVAVAVLWVGPSAGTGSSVREKGGPAADPIIAISCLGGSLAACPPGSRIAFWLEGGPQETGVVTAYGDPVSGGERVWYLTNQAVPRAALLGSEQPRGRYRVNVLLTKRPIERAELGRLTADVVRTRASFELVVESP